MNNYKIIREWESNDTSSSWIAQDQTNGEYVSITQIKTINNNNKEASNLNNKKALGIVAKLGGLGHNVTTYKGEWQDNEYTYYVDKIYSCSINSIQFLVSNTKYFSIMNDKHKYSSRANRDSIKTIKDEYLSKVQLIWQQLLNKVYTLEQHGVQVLYFHYQ